MKGKYLKPVSFTLNRVTAIVSLSNINLKSYYYTYIRLLKLFSVIHFQIFKEVFLHLLEADFHHLLFEKGKVLCNQNASCFLLNDWVHEIVYKYMHIVQHTLKIAMESSIRVEKSFKKKNPKCMWSFLIQTLPNLFLLIPNLFKIVST